MRFPLGILFTVALLFTSCATRPKTYNAPDASKVTATTKRLSAAIAKSEATRVRVEAKIQESQVSADKLSTTSASVLTLLRDLEPFIPPEQKPKFDELKAAADSQIVEEGKLSASIAGTRGEVEQLKKDHAAVVTERDQLVVDQSKYQESAQGIANDATNERNLRIKAEAQLAKEKWIRLAWKIGGGLFVAIIIGVIVLFCLGKLGWAGAKIAAKF